MTQEQLEKAKSGDKQAFKVLVETYQKPLYYFLLKILKNPDLVNDVMQDTFIKVYKHLENFEGRSSIQTWIFQIASNNALTELSKIKKNHEPIDNHDLQNDELENQESKVLLLNAIEKSLNFLTPTQQMVFRLRHQNSMSTKDAADHMQCSEGHIKKQLFLAMEFIRSHLKKHHPDLLWN
jgi:RNA polymerase sigma-70 factor (ECF subfamily)